MSGRNRRRTVSGGPDWGSMTKAERRAAAKAAKARVMAARKRRQTLLSVLAGVAVLAVVVAAFTLLGRGGSDDGTEARTAASPSAGSPAAGTPAAATTPQLPPGADPALGRKPAVSAGQGALSKLVVTPLIKGTGPAAQPGQRLTVNYVGVAYPTGQEFDASWGRGEPLSFTLGQGGVIKGWDQGLAGVTVGSRVQLDIPAALAYGENPTDGQPAGPLRFVVDLLDAR